jgi:diguanylate cyclase (GGDEF)-like protein
MSVSRDEISNRHLASLWVSVRDALDALGKGELDSVLARADGGLLVSALATDAQRLANALLHYRPAPEIKPAAVPHPRSKVLVVDDDPQAVAALSELLADLFEVTVTTHPTEVARLLREDPPDAVVTDLHMPGLDGLALMELVQSSSSPAPPVLFVTGSSDASARLKALEHGAFDFLLKPVDPAELSARIHRAVLYSNEMRRQSVLQQTDELTGLLNRRALKVWLSAALEEARRTGEPLTAAMVDQDGLKAINDRYGHAVGDESIVTVAAALAGACRACDAVARLGGDEFALVLRGSAQGVRDRLEQISQRLAAARLSATDPPPRLRVSWGIATARSDDDGASLLARADQALYEMKREKKNGGPQ